MKSKCKVLITNSTLPVAAFFLPVLIMVLAFAVTDIYPFGDSQIAIIDMYHQYVPFLSELQYKLHHGGSLLYTWNGAGGSNFWCLLAYYGATPLNLLLILFPSKYVMEGITVIFLIKIGLAGSFMYLFLSRVQYNAKAPSEVIHKGQYVALSTLYALSSYVMGYFWCIMWMDAIMLLPLCMLGLHRLIEGKNTVLYTVTLALIVICNYYIGIMVCIFILVYYPVLYFIKNKEEGPKTCLLTTIKAVVHSLVAIAMSAVMLLPTYLSMQNTYYISSEMPDTWTFFNDPLNVVNQLLPATQLTYREGLPNLYCGMATVILFALFLLNRKVPLREKILNGAFLVFMFFSLNINVLDFMWHGFHFPNQLPFRYSFVICFVLVAIAGRSLSLLDGIKPKFIVAILALGSVYYLIAQKLLAEKLDDANWFFYFGIATLAAYGILLLVYRNRKVSTLVFTILLLVFVVGESSVHTVISFEKTSNTTRSLYFENYSDVEKLVAHAENRGFARTEIDKGYTLNSPAFYHYKGLSQFSSSINSNVTTLMEELGFEGSPAKNRTNYNPKDPVSNAMFNVKYLIARNTPMDDPDFELIKQSGDSSLYENKYPLSIGYVLPGSIMLWDVYSTNPFINLDDFVNSATDGQCPKVFQELNDYDILQTNATCTDDGYGHVNAEAASSSAQSEVSLEYTAKKTDKHYVYVEADNAETITVQREDDTKNIEVREDSGSIINIGEVKKGETFKVTVLFETGLGGSIYSYVRTMDQEAWEQAYALMSRDMLQVTESTDRSLTGYIDVSQSGMLVLSIPYEKGWVMKIDGQEENLSDRVGDLWITAPVTEGNHEIELTFTPPGLKLGIIITILSILLLAALQVFYGARQKRRQQESAAPEVDETSDDVVDIS